MHRDEAREAVGRQELHREGVSCLRAFDAHRARSHAISRRRYANLLQEIGEEDDSSGQLLRMFKMLRLFRLMKLLRLVKIMRLMERYQDDLFKYIAYLSVVKLVMIMLYVGHLFACFFHYFSVDDWRTSEENAQIADGTLTPWLREYFDDADPTAKDVVDRYIASMYWAFTTMTTVGYGDISAVTRVERVIAIFGMIIGGFVFSAIIGTMAEVMGKTDLSRKAHSHKMESVAAFIRDENLPKSMFKEALAFFRRQTVEGYDRASLLRELPFELRKKIMYHSFADVIELAPLFDVAPDVGVDATVFVTELCSRLRPATYSPSELVYASGEIGSTMFILRKGQIEVLDDAPGGGPRITAKKNPPPSSRRWIRARTSARGACWGTEGAGRTCAPRGSWRCARCPRRTRRRCSSFTRTSTAKSPARSGEEGNSSNASAPRASPSRT